VKKLFLAASLVALGCSREQPAAPQDSTPPVPAAAAAPAAVPPAPPNLLDMVHGAAVISRTGEAVLGSSPVRAIDTDPQTAWINPPQNVKQTLVFSFGARARVDQIGVVTAPKPPNEIKSAKFELSEDGEHFTDAGIHDFKAKPGPQLAKINPTTARYVRVTTLTSEADYVQIASVYASGELLDKPQAPSIDGCWSINGMPARFRQSGAHVVGYVGSPLNTYVEGGTDGRFLRLTWLRSNTPEYGLAALTLTPDGKHLSAIVWHEEAIQAPQFLADDWLGERGPCPIDVKAQPLVAVSYFERFGYLPLYGLRFDDAGHFDETQSAELLDEVVPYIKPGARFVAHELLGDPAISQTRLDTLRAALQKRGVSLTGVDFVAMGNRDPRRPGTVDLVRAMYSSVELQIRR